MLQINANGYESPNSTSFRVGAAQPELERNALGEQVLNLVNGRGSRRKSWGEPGVNSIVILNNEDLVAVHVGFFHKYGGGQFYRYYVLDGIYYELAWARLTDEQRMRVLDAYEDNAPEWAKVPGKLRKDYALPNLNTLMTHKIVHITAHGYQSVYSSPTKAPTPYELGKRLAEKVEANHQSGFYSYTDRDVLMTRFHDGSLFPDRCYDQPMELAVIECEISGTMIHYASGKIASTYLRPIQEVQRFSYTPASMQAAS